MVSHSADLSKYSHLSIQFSNQFPQMPDLGVLLAQLRKPMPYSTCLVDFLENKTIYLEALSWLLRNDLVVQLHMFIYIVIPEQIRASVRLSHAGMDSTDSLFASDEPYLIPDAINPSPIETEYLALLASTQPPPFSSIFLKIARYLCGRYHINEISYRENISKRDLKLLLSRYREYLCNVFR